MIEDENRRLSLLIIDDEEEVRETLKSHCDLLGVFDVVVMASNGVEGLYKINNQHFDVILMDINMPKKDGLSLVKILKHDILERIIVISAGLSIYSFSELYKAGIKKFLIKPFDEKQLFDQLGCNAKDCLEL